MLKIASRLPNFTLFQRVTFYGVVKKNFLERHIRINNKQSFKNYLENLNDGETIKIILERIE